MSSRDKDQTTPHHQPLLSSLVVRPSVGDGGGDGGGRREYEPGEVRRDPPPAYRSDRYSDEPALNVACKNLGLEEGIMVGMPHSHKFGSGRDHGRYRDPSPPYAQGRGGGRSFGRDFGGPALGPGPLRGEGMNRNNPNVRPREGDWTCPDPSCGNLNFARREYCNNCKRFRYAPVGSPRRGYSGPPPPPPLAPPSRRFSGPPMDISSDRPMNGFRSPPRGWGMSGHGPREFGAGGPPPSRHEGRFSDHMRRDRLDLPDYGYRGRNKPMPPMDWSHRDRGRDNFNERKGYDRRAPSPPPAALVPPHRGRWGQDMRERSRSPIRGAPPPKGYHQDMYMERGRNDGRGVRRDGIRNAY